MAGSPLCFTEPCGTRTDQPIPGACLDVRQNAATGFYAVQQPEVQPPTNLRGVYRTDDQGRYEIRTVRPVPYPIPADGPVGRLLADTGRHPWRAAHIHARVSAAGCEPLTTHLFDRDSDYLDSDAAERMPSRLERVVREQADEIAELKRQAAGDSSNSSRPPSSDAPWAKKPAKMRSSRTRSGRKSGTSSNSVKGWLPCSSGGQSIVPSSRSKNARLKPLLEQAAD
jgi:Dioxygenase/Family of unknown function (DUF6444)